TLPKPERRRRHWIRPAIERWPASNQGEHLDFFLVNARSAVLLDVEVKLELVAIGQLAPDDRVVVVATGAARRRSAVTERAGSSERQIAERGGLFRFGRDITKRRKPGLLVAGEGKGGGGVDR